jgi:Flp pilus assembly protein TadB
MGQESGDWEKRYRASLRRQRAAQAGNSDDGIEVAGRLFLGLGFGFVAAVYWVFTTSNPWLAASMAVLIGFAIAGALTWFVTSRRDDGDQ